MGEGIGESGLGGVIGGRGNRPSTASGNTHTWPPANPASPDSAGSVSLQLGPVGRWWNDKDFARNLRLDSAQQRRMDDVFADNRSTLLKLYKNLKQEETQLAKTSRAKELDEAQIFARIDRVTQARGELEKANAHLLLQLRKELTLDQTAKLDDLRPPD